MVRKKKILLLVSDITLYIIAISLGLLLGFDKIRSIKPFRRGFFCSDDSIRYPYQPDTISTELAAAIGTLVPIVTVVLVEIFYGKLDNVKVLVLFRRLYLHVGYFLFGQCLCLMLTEILKLFVGRLRPHFLDLCRPDMTSLNCSIGYITQYECSVSETGSLTDARKSFPSGHASLLSFGMLYIAIYLQIKVRMSFPSCRLICPLLQTTAIGLGMYISVTRIQDNMHHTSDVIGGAIIGILLCIYTAFCFVKLQNQCIPRGRVSDNKTGDGQVTIVQKGLYARDLDMSESQLNASYNSTTPLENNMQSSAKETERDRNGDVTIITGL